MKIYGLKLPTNNKYVHIDESHECDEDCQILEPEKDYSSACHLYVDYKGVYYIGFELSLGLSKEEMQSLLKQKGRVYSIN